MFNSLDNFRLFCSAAHSGSFCSDLEQNFGRRLGEMLRAIELRPGQPIKMVPTRNYFRGPPGGVLLWNSTFANAVRPFLLPIMFVPGSELRNAQAWAPRHILNSL